MSNIRPIKRLSQGQWKTLHGSDVGAKMIINGITVTGEVYRLTRVHAFRKWLEEHATGLFYVTEYNPDINGIRIYILNEEDAVAFKLKFEE